MDNNTLEITDALNREVSDATAMLAIAGLAVDRVEVRGDETRILHVSTSDPAARACPKCGVFSTAHKAAADTSPNDIRYGNRMSLVWHKHRWRCKESRCPRKSFTESLPTIPAGARCTTRLKDQMGEAVAEQGRCVAEVARYFGASWHTTHDAFTAWVKPTLAAPLPEVKVLGLDEVRRGKAIWRKNLLTEKWELVEEVFHTGFVDSAGSGGLLGHVTGRTSAAVTKWLKEQPEAWREAITHVTIDLSAAYAKAAREALPDAQVVADKFHVVKLGNDMVTKVRQRQTQKHLGRRGGKDDYVWRIRRKLLTGQENLKPKVLESMLERLDSEGELGAQVVAVWRIKEALRDLLALSTRHPVRSEISHRLTRFYALVADTEIPEAHKLAKTVEKWWSAIEAALLTGYSNARSEGYNRVAKTIARNAYGFRNPTNHRRRVRWACTRQHRRKTGMITRLPC
jgi:transposase